MLSTPSLELSRLEELSLSRAYEQVVDLGGRLLKQRWSDADTALIRLLVGEAFCRLMRPEDGLRHVRPARAYFELMHDEGLAVEALDWEAAAIGVLEDPDALALAHRALDRCRALDPTPVQLEARILGHIAGMHVVGQSWAEAVHFYEAAADAAGKVKDLLQEAKMQHGLGDAYQRMHQPARAQRHFQRAIALYALERDMANVCRAENDLGYLLLEEGRLDEAEEHLVKALAGCDQLDNLDRRGRGFILNSLGELNLLRGELDIAMRCLKQALDAGITVGERLVQAQAHVLLAQAEEQRANPLAADRHVEAALELLEQVGMPDRLRDCHLRYAQMLAARGQLGPASHHRRMAGSSGD